MGNRLRTNRLRFPARSDAFTRHQRETARRVMLLGINKLLRGIGPYSTDRGAGSRRSHHPKELECGRRLASAGTQGSFSKCRLQKAANRSEMNEQSRNVARNQQHPFLRHVLSMSTKPVNGRPNTVDGDLRDLVCAASSPQERTIPDAVACMPYTVSCLPGGWEGVGSKPD